MRSQERKNQNSSLRDLRRKAAAAIPKQVHTYFCYMEFFKMSRSEHRNVCKIFLVIIGLLATNKVHGSICECDCQDVSINCEFFKSINLNNIKLKQWIQHSQFLSRFAVEWELEIGNLKEKLPFIQENAEMAEKISNINSKLHAVETLAQDVEKLQKEKLLIVKENADMAEKISNINGKLHAVESLAQDLEKRLNEEQKIREKLQEDVVKVENALKKYNETKWTAEDHKTRLHNVENRTTKLENELSKEQLITNHLQEDVVKVVSALKKYNETKWTAEDHKARLHNVENRTTKLENELSKEQLITKHLQNGFTNIPFTVNIKPTNLSMLDEKSLITLNVSLDLEGKLNISLAELKGPLQLHTQNSIITDPGTSMHLELEFRKTSVAGASSYPCLHDGCPKEYTFADIRIWNTTERLKEMKKRICENYDYVWWGAIGNYTSDNGFYSITFKIYRVIKEGIEKASDIQYKYRTLVIRDDCDFVAGAYHVFGKDCQNSGNEQHSASRRYFLDKTTVLDYGYSSFIPSDGIAVANAIKDEGCTL